MFTEGALLLERLAGEPPRSAAPSARPSPTRSRRCRTRRGPTRSATPRRSPPQIDALLAEHPLRDLVTTDGPYPFFADRERALFGAWYEFFPRSEGAYVDEKTGKVVSGTLRTAAKRLDAVAAMGFDIIYLPPIHPIGEVNRKGRNNTLDPGPDDPGSPWAIGSDEGGHDAIHPDLGTDEGPRRVRAAGQRARPRGRPRPRAAGGARPPVGQEAPRVVHHPRRRHHRLRREPAEEVPGHLPGQLRQRPRGHLRRGAADRPARGCRTACGSSASTTRTPSRSSSGSGCSARSARPTRTCSSCPRRSPSRR